VKFFISIILTAALSFVSCFYLPWRSIALSAFLISILIPQTPSRSFIAAFAGVFLLWGGLSFWISSINDHILAHKVSLLIIKIDSPYLLIIVTALIGGLVSGLGALTASYLRNKPQSHSTT